MSTCSTNKKRCVAIIQSRMGSTRLPGKSIAVIAGKPMICHVMSRVLSAKNIDQVVLATSSLGKDDPLAKVCEDHDFKCHRGSEDDVLDRFYQAAVAENAEVCVRICGDCPLIDPYVIDQCVQAFADKTLDYLSSCTDYSARRSFPNGLDVEVFSFKALEIAWKEATEDLDREHLTRFIVKYIPDRFSSGTIEEELLPGVNLGDERWCVDYPADLDFVRAVFDHFSPNLTFNYADVHKLLVTTPSIRDMNSDHKQMKHIVQVQESPGHRRDPSVLPPQVQRLGLGTVQLGLTYGINNTTGLPSSGAAKEIIMCAVKAGVQFLDTARAYGLSETRIGKTFDGEYGTVTVVTKLAHMPKKPTREHQRPPIDNTFEQKSAKFVKDNEYQKNLVATIHASVFRSLYELRLRRLPILVTHSFADFQRPDIWSELKSLQNANMVEKLGVSVYTPDEAVIALENQDVKLLQIPFNMLDWRWRTPRVAGAFAKRPDVIVHARSMFLQGLFFRDPSGWPGPIDGVNPAFMVSKLKQLIIDCNKKNMAELCVSFSLSPANNFITCFLTGVDNLDQLAMNIASFNDTVPLTIEQVAHVEKTLGKVPEQLLDPRYWPKNK